MGDTIDLWKKELVDAIHFMHAQGWAPATSSNYSFKRKEDSSIHISSSGIDKGLFSEKDLMQVDSSGAPLADDRRPSAETLLHTMIYDFRPALQCVLHTHTIFNTTLSALFSQEGKISLEGFEVLKGLKGIRTHDTSVEVPIFENSQDISNLAEEVKTYWKKHPNMQGFLLAGHGLYSWGETIAEAKRQIEVFEFLFECYYRIQQFKK